MDIIKLLILKWWVYLASKSSPADDMRLAVGRFIPKL